VHGKTLAARVGTINVTPWCKSGVMEAADLLAGLRDAEPVVGGVRLSLVTEATGLGQLELLIGETDRLRDSLVCEAGGFAAVEAADFADRVEELSRTVEFLQVLAA